MASNTKKKDDDDHHDKKPLLDVEASNHSNEDQEVEAQTAINKTFQSVANLAHLLPTGSVLAFQLLAPIFTNSGHCDDANRVMTACLVAFCGLSCFVLSFTDSFRDTKGIVRYGLATFKGLWVIDGTTALTADVAAVYKIKVIDFIHGFLSALVFVAVVLFDRNTVACFYPSPSEDVNQVLTALPVGIGVVSSMLFVTFPTTRHGIGFPLSTK